MHKDRFSIEEKLMCYCARTTMDDSIKKQLEELLEMPPHLLDWTWILKQSRHHGISSLLYYNINKIPKANIPKAILTMSRDFYYDTLAKNIQLWIEFRCIQDAFNKAGIKTIPLKGIILSQTLYRNLGLRPMGDIDILVKEENLSNAKDELVRLGYKFHLKDLPEDYWRKHHCHLRFYNPHKDIVFELHWTLTLPRPNKINIDEVWHRSRTQIVDHSEVLVLSYEDTLLSLCLHICNHISNLQSPKLKNLCDIHELISQYGQGLNWDYIIDKIVSWRFKGCIFYLYLLTETYFGTRWPKKVISKVKIGIIQSIVLNPPFLNIQRRSRFQASLLMLTMQDTMVDCIISALQRLRMSLSQTLLRKSETQISVNL